MLKRIAKSINVAVQVAVLGFEKSYKEGETLDSILGFVDCLTELPNRKAFERDRDFVDETYSMIMIDIDNFKSINDTHGHLYGDRVLQRLAAILSFAVMPGGRVYRLAGDEFVCIVPRNEVVSVCDAIRSNVRKEDSFTISQGVLLCLNRGITNEAFTQADTAMYQSKQRGKDSITMVMPELMPVN